MKKIVLLWRKLIASSRQKPESRDQDENGHQENSRDPQYVTRIYGGGIETGVKL